VQIHIPPEPRRRSAADQRFRGLGHPPSNPKIELREQSKAALSAALPPFALTLDRFGPRGWISDTRSRHEASGSGPDHRGLDNHDARRTFPRFRKCRGMTLIRAIPARLRIIVVRFGAQMPLHRLHRRRRRLG
jgi:hypothetical protein